ncbi:MAG TPA: hypothetical protein VF399_09560 [bacterium]
MKKVLIAIIPIIALTFIVLSVLNSRTSADEFARWLSGYVKYENGNGVGSGKNVFIYDSPTHYVGYDATDGSSQYQWNFYPPFYVYKVKCSWSGLYSGETIIDRTLSEDTQVDITVHYVGGDTTK